MTIGFNKKRLIFMKLSLISKGENLSDPEATGNIFFLIVVMLLMSILCRDFVLLFLCEPMIAIVPGIYKASLVSTHVDSAKSFWSFTWCLFPFLSFWVICLAFMVKDQVPVKKMCFFYASFLLVFSLLLGYEGTIYVSTDSVYWRGRIYGDSLFGMYALGFGYWGGVYLCLFATSRFLTSWARKK